MSFAKKINIVKLIIRFSSWAPAYLVFIASVILTLVATLGVRYSSNSEQKIILDNVAENSVQAIQYRIELYKSVLSQLRSFYNASQFVERAEFREFTKDLDLAKKIPGIEGTGYSPRIKRKNINKHEQTIRKTGLLSYKIWPPVETEDEYFPVIYFESEKSLSNNIFGYNILSGPMRAQAAKMARDNNEATATRVTFLTEILNKEQARKFLIFLPLYNPKLPINSIEQRRRAHIGYVFCLFSADEMFLQILKALSAEKQFVSLEIYDDAEMASLVFNSSEISNEKFNLRHREGETQSKVLQVTVASHTWIARTTVLSEGLYSKFPWLILCIGLFISVLFFLVLSIAQKNNRILKSELLIRQHAEIQIEKTKADAERANLAKSQFLANMSHEIRTPLTIILGYSDLALGIEVNNAVLQKYLSSIRRNATLLANIIGDILDLSKIEANRMDVEIVQILLMDLVGEVVEALEPSAKKNNIKISINLAEAMPRFIMTDLTKIKQILTNLISNAIKFTRKGFVNISIYPESALIASQPVRLVFEIKDTGVGISKEFEKKIFQPFCQDDPSLSRKYGGTGLGLFLSKELAKTLGGELRLVDTKPNVGSVFGLTLPVGLFNGVLTSDKETKLRVKPSEDAKINLSRNEDCAGNLIGKKVLLIEDLFESQVLVTQYLKAAQMIVDVADDGAQGVEMALHGEYDILLMDLQIPVLDGYAATRELRNRGFNKPIIAFTAHALSEEREQAIRLGFSGYLTKPFTKDKLYSCLKDLLT